MSDFFKNPTHSEMQDVFDSSSGASDLEVLVVFRQRGTRRRLRSNLSWRMCCPWRI